MAKVIVTTDESSDPIVLMAENVQPIHLQDEHSSLQLIERLAWAVDDAESLRPVIAARRKLERRRLRTVD